MPAVQSRSSWRPSKNSAIDARSAFVLSPFTRLARTHALLAGGDALVAFALAKSVFFSASADESKFKVALYLLLTMAPFAVVAPLIGPVIDRMAGGRRLMLLLSAGVRALLAFAMVSQLKSLVFFPLAFMMLVSSKTYTVALKAVVPGVVHGEGELVEANSKLGLISGLAGVLAAVPGGLLFLLNAPSLIVALAALVFATGMVVGLRIPALAVAPQRANAAEKAELRSAGIFLAASAMAVQRAVIGFLTFQVLFLFRREHVPNFWFGMVLAFSTGGSLLGNALAPLLRRQVREEIMLTLALGVICGTAIFTSLSAGRLSAALLCGAAGIAAGTGRLAFDSIVQRDAPDANKGRSLATFETRFQLAWVGAAFFPVLLPIPARVGFLAIAIGTGSALVTYLVGMRAVQAGRAAPTPLWRQVRTRVRTRESGPAAPGRR
ncbi:MAG: putative major facilitator superfamily transporter, partial [Acidimicrobiia bacterium]|nr:putative major facilitator superfamily transporter [Acidimicrobiia bacterium]